MTRKNDSMCRLVNVESILFLLIHFSFLIARLYPFTQLVVSQMCCSVHM